MTSAEKTTGGVGPAKLAVIKSALLTKLPGEKWGDFAIRKEAAAKAEREELKASLLVELTAELDALPVGDVGGCNQYRADGRSPWQMVEDHGGWFQPFKPTTSVLDTLRWFFGDPTKTPEEKVQLWISAKPSGMAAVSSGPNRDDNQGASNAQWYYALVLDETDADRGALGFPATPSRPGESAPVKLYSSGGHHVVSGGRLAECIWIGGIPRASVVAYKRAGGQPWEQVWRPFTNDAIEDHKRVLSRAKYGPLFMWENIYRTSR